MYNLYILYKKDKYIYTVIKCLLFFPLQLQFWVYSIQEKSTKLAIRGKNIYANQRRFVKDYFGRRIFSKISKSLC